MPGLVKIGFSTKDPLLRASELANTGAPHTYEVEYDALVDSPRDLERQLHVLLARHLEGREWFRLSVHEAIESLRGNATHIYSERVRGGRVLSTMTTFQDQALGQTGAVSERCQYTPDCSKFPTRNYHQMLFCEEHYKTYMLGRKTSRRRTGPSSG